MRMALFAAMLTVSGIAFAQDMQSGTTVAPGNNAPERDARGIPVVSDPAVAPPGFNQPPQVGGTGAPANATPAPMADNGPSPPCSRTVTDNCVQTYERGGGRRGVRAAEARLKIARHRPDAKGGIERLRGVYRERRALLHESAHVGVKPVKKAFITAGLLISGSAIAQDYPATAMPEETTTVETTETAAAPAGGAIVAPSNANPERDARGIAVISDPAAVPSGFNGTLAAGMGGPLVDPATGATIDAADDSYPACTATVTDNCVQTYERGRSPR